MNMPEFIRKRFAKKIDLHENYQLVFSTPQGKEVLAHILKEGYMFKATGVKDLTGSLDSNQTLLNEGKRMLALSIFKYVNKDHTQLVQQIEEQLKQYETTQ